MAPGFFIATNTMTNRTDSERIVAIETTVTDIKHRLLGNGQPGEIDHLHERINAHGRRISKIENWRWWLMGIGLGIGMAGGASVAKLLETLK